MKLVYRGIYRDASQLAPAALPPGAVPFREPEPPERLNRACAVFMAPVAAFVALAIAAAALLHGSLALRIDAAFFVAVALSLVVLPIHEFLHAVCFGRNAEVSMYISPRHFMAFVVSPAPVAKRRFLVLNLLPNLVCGGAPLLLWVVFAPPGFGGALLFWFGVFSLSMGIGDYMNVWNTLRQMPRGSVQQLSGFHSWWYLPEGARTERSYATDSES